jgi:hypothetical protein
MPVSPKILMGPDGLLIRDYPIDLPDATCADCKKHEPGECRPARL